MTNWFIGQKIVCVSNTYVGYGVTTGKPITYDFSRRLVVGDTYTIRGISAPKHPRNDLVLCLEELIHPTRGPHIGFPASCFRPVVDKKTDITVFKEMLHNMPTDVLV